MSPSILENASRLGRYRHLELVLFERLGARAVSGAGPRHARFLFEASLAHGYRARLFEECLPVSVGLPGPDELTVALARPLAELVEESLRAGDDELVAGLGGLVYPAMLDAYRSHLEAGSPVSDAPVLLALERAITDLEARRRAASELAPWREAPASFGALAEALHTKGAIFRSEPDRSPPSLSSETPGRAS